MRNLKDLKPKIIYFYFIYSLVMCCFVILNCPNILIAHCALFVIMSDKKKIVQFRLLHN